MVNTQNMPRVLEMEQKRSVEDKENNTKGEKSLFFYV